MPKILRKGNRTNRRYQIQKRRMPNFKYYKMYKKILYNDRDFD